MDRNINRKPMVSVVILTYRNYNYVFDTLSSVFTQTYPNIELIISDDGSPQFPVDDIEAYVEANKKENIKNVLVNCEKINQGTVKHLNKTISLASGEYLVFLAGDDIFASSEVLQNYISNFQASSDKYLIQMAQTAMYDNSLTKLESYYCRPDVENMLYENDFSGLLEKLCLYPCLPSTSTCFSRAFFQEWGLFDENYILIEDWPLHLKLAKEKCPILYDNFIAIKHRHGGISHGAKDALSVTQSKYYADIRNIHRQIIIPVLPMIATEGRKRILNQIYSEDKWIEWILSKQSGKIAILKYMIKYPLHTVKTGLVKFNERYKILFSNLIKLGFTLFILYLLCGPMLWPLSDSLSINLVGTVVCVVAKLSLSLGVIGRICCFGGEIITKLETFPYSCLYID